MEKEHTREVHVEIGGETRRILLCLWGLVLAEEQGFDISDLAIDQEEAEEQQGNAKKMLDMLWVGMLPFNEDLKRKDLGMDVGFGDLPAIEKAFTEVTSRQLTDEVEEKIEEASSGDGDEGKSAPES